MSLSTDNSQLTTANSPLALRADDLVAGYERRVLLRNLFLSVPEGAFVAIVGHNGAGKTTLFRVLTGQLPYQGTVEIAGRDLRTVRRPAVEGLLAHLPQRNVVGFPIEVRELVVMGRFRQHRGLLAGYTSADYAQADAALREVGAAHLAHRDFTLLSGGEQQLVWLAQLRLQDAALWLLDEPTQQLDVYYRRRVFSLLRRWGQEYRKTILCITHDLEQLPAMPGYLLNMSAPEPQLQPLSRASVDAARAWLEDEASLARME
ncbi:ABC transporter ATP-binding protein [Hymenobacter edaphi]|uniref:ABC transporter ATP-binding protein n=1 Tax=Hymenobacter edaphi TaxID=2211146 RepID=A0A328BLI1_9BACT|nr:ABC transporter ATP-binding protein [Hymenobacter edaphi]